MRCISTPPTKNSMNSLTHCKKLAKEAFGSEAQKFIDKAIYAKMPDHVKKIPNRAYSEDKPYNDIVLHLEREMRLKGLGAPDETTLVPLNTVDAVVTDEKKEPQQRRYCFHCGKYGHHKAQCRRLRKERYYANTKTNNKDSNQNKPLKPKCDTCGKMHKTENCWDGANAANDPVKETQTKVHHPNGQYQRITRTNHVNPSKKLKSPRLRSAEKVDATAYTIEDPPNRYEDEFFYRMHRRTNPRLATSLERRHDTQTQGQTFRRSNATTTTELPDSYATLKRPLPESKTERFIYMTGTIDVILGTSQPYMTQKTLFQNPLLKFQTLKFSPQKQQNYHHRHNQF